MIEEHFLKDFKML